MLPEGDRVGRAAGSESAQKEERPEDPDIRRQEQLPKDVFVIYRLLRAIDTAELASQFDPYSPTRFRAV